MKFVLAAASIAIALALPNLGDTELFEAFKVDHNKTYTGDEHGLRFNIFKANLRKIEEHNKDPRWSYTLALNKFADLTLEEFKVEFATGRNRAVNEHSKLQMAIRDNSGDISVNDLPASLDWREKKVVTPAKDQGGCGSCWAFSTAETLESHIAITTGTLMEFAPQEFVDCTPNPQECGGTGGCSGATQELGFGYAITAGITTEKSYPYTAQTGTCEISKKKIVAGITGFEKIESNNYTALMNAVVTVGPIAISAAAEPWQFYSGGVYNGHCGADVDHAIVLVGYGVSGTKPYWLVRNSWGTSWGEEGYIRIERYGNSTAGETCYTDSTPSDGDGCKGGPSSIQVCGLCGILSDSSYPTGGHLVTSTA